MTTGIEPLDLVPLDAPSYAQFMAELKSRYIADRKQGNILSEQEATEFTDTQWASILPGGKNTEGHHFFELKEPSTGVRLGATWIFVEQPGRGSFIFDLYLEPSFRGKGLGKPALEAISRFVKAKGARTLGLNVFASNKPARSLYESFGFREVSTDMIIQL